MTETTYSEAHRITFRSDTVLDCSNGQRVLAKAGTSFFAPVVETPGMFVLGELPLITATNEEAER